MADKNAQTIDSIKVGLGIDATSLGRDVRRELNKDFKLTPQLQRPSFTALQDFSSEISESMMKKGNRNRLGIKVQVRFDEEKATAELEALANKLSGSVSVDVPVNYIYPEGGPQQPDGGGGGGGGAPRGPTTPGGPTAPAAAPAQPAAGATAAGAIATSAVATQPPTQPPARPAPISAVSTPGAVAATATLAQPVAGVTPAASRPAAPAAPVSPQQQAQAQIAAAMPKPASPAATAARLAQPDPSGQVKAVTEADQLKELMGMMPPDVAKLLRHGGIGRPTKANTIATLKKLREGVLPAAKGIGVSERLKARDHWLPAIEWLAQVDAQEQSARVEQMNLGSTPRRAGRKKKGVRANIAAEAAAAKTINEAFSAHDFDAIDAILPGVGAALRAGNPTQAQSLYFAQQYPGVEEWGEPGTESHRVQAKGVVELGKRRKSRAYKRDPSALLEDYPLDATIMDLASGGITFEDVGPTGGIDPNITTVRPQSSTVARLKGTGLKNRDSDTTGNSPTPKTPQKRTPEFPPITWPQGKYKNQKKMLGEYAATNEEYLDIDWTSTDAGDQLDALAKRRGDAMSALRKTGRKGEGAALADQVVGAQSQLDRRWMDVIGYTPRSLVEQYRRNGPLASNPLDSLSKTERKRLTGMQGGGKKDALRSSDYAGRLAQDAYVKRAAYFSSPQGMTEFAGWWGDVPEGTSVSSVRRDEVYNEIQRVLGSAAQSEFTERKDPFRGSPLAGVGRRGWVGEELVWDQPRPELPWFLAATGKPEVLARKLESYGDVAKDTLHGINAEKIGESAPLYQRGSKFGLRDFPYSRNAMGGKRDPFDDINIDLDKLSLSTKQALQDYKLEHRFKNQSWGGIESGPFKFRGGFGREHGPYASGWGGEGDPRAHPMGPNMEDLPSWRHPLYGDDWPDKVSRNAMGGKKDDWLTQNLSTLNAEAERLSLGDVVEEMSARGMTAKQVANVISSELGGSETDPQLLVRAVRSKRNIPSMDDRDEFNKWMATRRGQKEKPWWAGENATRLTDKRAMGGTRASSLSDLPGVAANATHITEVGEQGREYIVGQRGGGEFVVPNHQLSQFNGMVGMQGGGERGWEYDPQEGASGPQWVPLDSGSRSLQPPVRSTPPRVTGTGHGGEWEGTPWGGTPPQRHERGIRDEHMGRYRDRGGRWHWAAGHGRRTGSFAPQPMAGPPMPEHYGRHFAYDEGRYRWDSPAHARLYGGSPGGFAPAPGPLGMAGAGPEGLSTIGGRGATFATRRGVLDAEQVAAGSASAFATYDEAGNMGGPSLSGDVQRVHVVNWPSGFEGEVAPVADSGIEMAAGPSSGPVTPKAATGVRGLEAAPVLPADAEADPSVGGVASEKVSITSKPLGKIVSKHTAEESVSGLRQDLDQVGIDISEALQKSPVRALSVAFGQIAQTMIGGRSGILARAAEARSSRRGAERVVGQLESAEGSLDFSRIQIGQLSNKLRKQGIALRTTTDEETGSLSVNPEDANRLAGSPAGEQLEALLSQQREAEEAVNELAPLASERVEKAKTDAKSILTPFQQFKAQAVGIGGIVGGTLVFGTAMQAAQVAVQAFTTAMVPAVDALTGFQMTMNEQVAQLGKAIQGAGGAREGVYGAFAESGLSISNANILAAGIGELARRQQGNENLRQQITLNRAQRGMDELRFQGITQPTGGFLGTEFMATPSTVEQVAGELPGAEAGMGGIYAQAYRVADEMLGPMVAQFQDWWGGGNREAERDERPSTPELLTGEVSNERLAFFNRQLDDKDIYGVEGRLKARPQLSFPSAEEIGKIAAMTEALVEMGADDRSVETLNVAGVFLDTLKSGDLVGNVEKLTEYFLALNEASVRPDPNVMFMAMQPQLRAQMRGVARDREFQERVVIPANVAQQLFNRPMAGMVGRPDVSGIAAPNAGGMEAGIAGRYGLRIGRVREQLEGLREEGRQGLLDLGVSPQAIASVERLGASIARLRVRSENLQLGLEQAQYNEQLYQTRRSLSDILGILGKTGVQTSELGRMQRAQIMDSRELSKIQLARSQRELNMQLALARLRAPGETAEERAVRRREAEVRTAEQQRELDIQRRSTTRGFAIEDTGFARQARDLGKQLELITQARAVSVEVRGINKLAEAKELMLSVKNQYIDTAKQSGIELRRMGFRVQTEIEARAGELNKHFAKSIRSWTTTQLEEYRRYYLEMRELFSGGGGAGATVPPSGNSILADSGPSAAGGIFGVKTATRFLAGEAGAEHVVVLRNPQTGMMPMGGGGGGPINISLKLNATVSNEGDEDRLARKVARMLHDEVSLLVGA
jgi:hypothetical protein